MTCVLREYLASTTTFIVRKFTRNCSIMTISSATVLSCSSKRNLPRRNLKRRIEAKLRKLRWIVYQKIRFRRKKRIRRLFIYYEKQVEMYLMQFSTKLKIFEIDIWKKKLMKTKDDIFDFLNKPQNTVAAKVQMKYKASLEYTEKFDSVLGMLSTVLHLVKKVSLLVGSPAKVEKDEVAAPDNEGLKGVIEVVEELTKGKFVQRKKLSELQRIKDENQENLSRDLENLLAVQVIKNDEEVSEVFTSVKKAYLRDNFVIMKFEHLVKPYLKRCM